jgi:hypothetical protein
MTGTCRLGRKTYRWVCQSKLMAGPVLAYDQLRKKISRFGEPLIESLRPTNVRGRDTEQDQPHLGS